MNPVHAAQRVTSDFLKYQLTAFPFSESRLYSQLRGLLSVDEPLASPLIKGPYISLSRAFRAGPALSALADEGIVHKHVPSLFDIQQVHGHQEAAIRAIRDRHATVVSTGTGSGKTECFTIPIVSHCLDLRDQGEPPGIRAVIVYPMNALAEDQLTRLRRLLVGTGIPFAMYVGKTPERESQVSGVRCDRSRASYDAKVLQLHAEGRNVPVLPPEEVASREKLRSPGGAPRILLTNVKMLELLLTRATDVELFEGARLDYLVLDEAHTFRGADGAEAALLMRRLRTYCGQKPSETIAIATSATLADPAAPEPARTYMSRFFGVDASDTVVVTEDYQDDEWSSTRFTAAAMNEDVAAAHLDTVLNALDLDEDNAGTVLRTVYRTITGHAVGTVDWRRRLFADLVQCENAYRLAEELKTPCSLDELCERLTVSWSRKVSTYEVLLWLALGSAARSSGRPLLRPVVHGFVRGIDGAIVTYPLGSNDPKLWLSAEDAEHEAPDSARLPVMTCNNCGLHYYATWLSDYEFTGNRPSGGHAKDDGAYWEILEESQGGTRCVLTDPPTHADDDSESDGPTPPPGTSPIDFCRACGTVNMGLAICGQCGGGDLVPLLAVKMDDHGQPAKMDQCISCGSKTRSFNQQSREPARPVRATVVADVHVLSQNLLQHSNTAKRRLLVFADSRQDAAFQAGWMRDHARRYRIRALVDDILRTAPSRLGRPALGLDDLVEELCRRFDADDSLSKTLLAEVWEVAARTAANKLHERERRDYLKLFLMRELASQQRQKTGLEPWGRVHIEYSVLSSDDPFIVEWSAQLAIPPARLLDGVQGILDVLRRRYCFYDDQTQVFTSFIDDSHRWVQRMYIPTIDGAPQAVKLTRRSAETRIVALSGTTRQSIGDRAARLWGVAIADQDQFLNGLWRYLTGKGALRRVDVRYDNGKIASGFEDAFQVDGGAVSLSAQAGVWRCGTCRRSFCRPLPLDLCLHHRCGGHVTWDPEDPDNYDLMTLREGYEMIRPREHSAQVPDEEREALEISFKGDSDEVNTLVCTPTLELGVDIGALDSVLLRNVPPLPSNYWQRVGRAGRRHRIALNLTYARPTRHDRSYYREPMKMLAGEVEPPRFNLQNPVMLHKHIRSVILASLHRLARPASGLGDAASKRIADALSVCFPARVAPLLFDDEGTIRTAPKSVASVQEEIAAHRERIIDEIGAVFESGWPADLAFLVDHAVVGEVVDRFGADLGEAIGRVFRRLRWAQDQIRRVSELKASRGSLDRDDEALERRCTQLIRRLKGEESKTRSEGEGLDDSNLFATLALESFLPGYGLTGGGVRGFAEPFRAPRFALRRPSAVGIREFVPGNLIYANNRRFYASHFQLAMDGDLGVRPFIVDVGTESLSDVAGAIGVGAQRMDFIPACDVDLQQRSLISDDEVVRFMMPVTVFVREESVHGQGQAYDWGGRTLDWRPQVHVLMANIGEARQARTGQPGYLICRVCGQARSPYASRLEVTTFEASHAKRCGRRPDRVGIYARAVVDCIRLQGCTRKEAYSVGEAIRIGASKVLEMEVEDLTLAAVPAPDHGGEVDLMIIDPMPGGSGLLQQALERWPEVRAAALEVVRDCPGQCNASCVDCLQSYRNQQYHPHLDRRAAESILTSLGDRLDAGQVIPAQGGSSGAGCMTTNVAEERLQCLLLRAGFTTPKGQHRIDLPEVSSHTVADFYFECETDAYDGVCVFLDGLSERIHGSEHQQERDRVLRSALEALDYAVVVIPASDLGDRPAMTSHFVRIARAIVGKGRAQEVRDSAGSWWADSEENSIERSGESVDRST